MILTSSKEGNQQTIIIYLIFPSWSIV